MKKSKFYLNKAEKLIPALSQTFSKAPYSYVQGVYPIYLKSGKRSHVFDVDDNDNAPDVELNVFPSNLTLSAFI